MFIQWSESDLPYIFSYMDKFLYLANSSILANESNSFPLYCVYQKKPELALSCVLSNPLSKRKSDILEAPEGFSMSLMALKMVGPHVRARRRLLSTESSPQPTAS